MYICSCILYMIVLMQKCPPVGMHACMHACMHKGRQAGRQAGRPSSLHIVYVLYAYCICTVCILYMYCMHRYIYIYVCIYVYKYVLFTIIFHPTLMYGPAYEGNHLRSSRLPNGHERWLSFKEQPMWCLFLQRVYL